MSRTIALVLMLIAPVPALAQDAVVLGAVTSFVKVRFEPASDGMMIGRLNIGESARLLRSDLR